MATSQLPSLAISAMLGSALAAVLTCSNRSILIKRSGQDPPGGRGGACPSSRSPTIVYQPQVHAKVVDHAMHIGPRAPIECEFPAGQSEGGWKHRRYIPTLINYNKGNKQYGVGMMEVPLGKRAQGTNAWGGRRLKKNYG
jgi:hypothetical protein